MGHEKNGHHSANDFQAAILLKPHIVLIQDDVIKWKHFPRYWPFVRGIHRLPVNSPHKGQWRGALMFSLIWAWINGWVNNRKAGDLRRHGAHYDVIVMSWEKDRYSRSLWPRDAIWWHRSQCNTGSGNLYLNQCWLLISEDLKLLFCTMNLKIIVSKYTATSHRGQWVTGQWVNLVFARICFQGSSSTPSDYFEPKVALDSQIYSSSSPSPMRWNERLCIYGVYVLKTRWLHQMETFSALLALCEENSTGSRWIPLTKSSDAELLCGFFYPRLNKRLSKQSSHRRFETPSHW